MPTRIELEREISRLREQVNMLEQREVRPDDMGIAGRIALTRLRDTDYPELVKAVEAIPAVYEAAGSETALSYCQTHVMSCLLALNLTDMRTADLVITQHRVVQMLDEGQAEIMFRRDRAGMRNRREFLNMAVRYFYAPSIRAAFNRGAETPAGLLPATFQKSD